MLQHLTSRIPAMTKVHPNTTFTRSTNNINKITNPCQTLINNPAVMTVWKKSLIFNCNGFTVFDSRGNLLFRVDNYMDGHKGEILLMDAIGKPLITIRRKRLSLGDSWLLYEGESTRNARYCIRKNTNILNYKTLAYISSCGSARNSKNGVMYEIEGSYAQRCCAIYDENKRKVAEVMRKEAVGGVAFGGDIFRLIVQPGFDTATAMALLISLDQMFRSTRRFST